MNRRPYGPGAWLVEDVRTPAAWASALGTMDVPGVIEIVPAEATVVVRVHRERHDAVGDVIDMVVPATTDHESEAPLTIDVVYDGPDIADLAHAAKMSIDDVVHLHATGSYRGGVLRVQPRLRLSAWDRPETPRPAACHAPRLRARRIRWHRSGLHLRLSVGFTRRLASDRPHDAVAVGCRPRSSGAASARSSGSIPQGAAMSRRPGAAHPPARLRHHRAGPRPTRPGPPRCADRWSSRSANPRSGQPVGRQSRRLPRRSRRWER